jgi:hypothetical protein
MTTLDDLLEDIDDLYTQQRIQQQFYAHQSGVCGAMERLLRIRHEALNSFVFELMPGETKTISILGPRSEAK